VYFVEKEKGVEPVQVNLNGFDPFFARELSELTQGEPVSRMAWRDYKNLWGQQ
jgi:hypothetical protein